MSIKSAVVGLGAMGRHHARLLADLSGSELVATCDADLERAREHAQLRGGTAYSSPEDLPGDLKAAVISTPTVSHCDIAVPLLRRGVSVMVEKPLATTLAEADEMIAAAAEGGAVLFVGHAERFNPGLSRVRSMIEAPIFVESHRLGIFPGRSLDIDVVLDLMIHDLDLLHWLTGAALESVEAIGVDVLTRRVDIANARLTFADACTANVTASRVSAEPTRKLRIFEADRYVSVDFVAQTAELFRLEASGDGAVIGREHFGPADEGQKEEPLRHELEAFLRAVAGEEPPAISGADGRLALESALRVVTAMDEQRAYRETIRKSRS